MVIRKNFRYRLEPNKAQYNAFAQFAGSCRFVYNWALARSIEAYEATGKRLSYADLSRELTFLKKNAETLWLAEIHAQVLQQALKDLDCAFQRFFRRLKNKEKPGFPKFKKKGIRDSFRYPQNVTIQDNKVWLPKIGFVSFSNSRLIEGVINQATVKREGKHWFVTFACTVEKEVKNVPYNQARAVGIDVGIKQFAVLSTGEFIENPRHLIKAQYRLAHEQRHLSRKVKGSNNRKKQAMKVAQLHITIKNSRKDYLHKISSHIVKNHDVVAVESLNISGMLKNHKLARSIADAGWHLFLSMLEYKAAWSGKYFVRIPGFSPTSKTCSACNAQQDMPLQIRTYSCKQCGLEMDRDHNASLNIRAAGLAVLNACGGIGVGLPYEARISGH